MKKIIFLIFISSFYFGFNSSLDAWKSILQTPELLSYFDNVFNYLGISIEETGEEFTIHHAGDKFIFSKGISKDKVDFIVPIKLENI